MSRRQAGFQSGIRLVQSSSATETDGPAFGRNTRVSHYAIVGIVLKKSSLTGSDGPLMTKDLKIRKQELVRDAIYHAAIDLFTSNGYKETRIDQIAQAAGVSQRSFFRYFATKDDLLGYSIAKRGDVLVSAVQACPAEMPMLDVIRKAVEANIEFALSQPQTRQIIEITAANLSARQAHRGGMVEVEDRLSDAFIKRTRHSNKFSPEPRMMAITTIMVSDLALTSWFVRETKDGATAVKTVFGTLTRLFCEPGASSGSSTAKVRRHKKRARQLAAV